MIEKIKWLEDKRKERVGDNQKFYPIVINDTRIIFSQKELDIQGVTGGTDQTSGECSLGHTIPI